MIWAKDNSLQSTLDFVRQAEESWAQGRSWPFTIFFEDEAGGMVELFHLRPVLRIGELGYWLRSDLWGQGLMTEAASAVAAAGFERAGLNRIEVRPGVDNQASIRVAEKIGCRREGRLRESALGGDGFYDTYMYALLARVRA